jgi:hypothetical protein
LWASSRGHYHDIHALDRSNGARSRSHDDEKFHTYGSVVDDEALIRWSLSQVIMITAHNSPEVAQGAWALGAYLVVSKPSEVENLAALVNDARAAKLYREVQARARNVGVSCRLPLTVYRPPFTGTKKPAVYRRR